MSGKKQCFLISGESGAGKTESTKLVLQHILRTSRHKKCWLQEAIAQVYCMLIWAVNPVFTKRSVIQSCTISIEKGYNIIFFISSQPIPLPQINPILEAFGNAKTTLNNNSSRFGKYVQLFVDSDGAVTGGELTNQYLVTFEPVKDPLGHRTLYSCLATLTLPLTHPLQCTYLNTCWRRAGSWGVTKGRATFTSSTISSEGCRLPSCTSCS